MPTKNGLRLNSSVWPRTFASGGYASKLGSSAVHNWDRVEEQLSATPTSADADITLLMTHDRARIEPVSMAMRTGLLKSALQLFTEKEFCAWRPPAGTVTASRRSQSLSHLLCTPDAQASDISAIS
jgi:hypothetical protein